MKARHNLKTIAQILDRRKSIASREVLRNSSSRGYRPQQAETICQQLAQASRNALQIDPLTRQQFVAKGMCLQRTLGALSLSVPRLLKSEVKSASKKATM